MKQYPFPYSFTSHMMIAAAIQSVVFALCMERSNWSQWKLGWNIRLLAVAYTGIVCSSITFTLRAWCIKVRGPLYVSIFSPLMLVMVAVIGSLILNEKLHLGSVLGAGIIVFGLYVFLWAKARAKKLSRLVPIVDNSKSEKIDIVVATSDETNNLKGSTRSNNSVIGIDPHDIAAIPCADSFDSGNLEEIANEMQDEDKNQGRV